MNHRFKTLLISLLTCMMCFIFTAPAPASADNNIIHLPVIKIPWLTLPSPYLVWKQPIGTGAIIGPVHALNHLFVAASDVRNGNHLYVFDLINEDYQNVQQFDYDQPITSLASRPNYSGVTLYVGTQSMLYAYQIPYSFEDHVTPSLLWTLPIGNTIDHAIFDTYGNIYVLSNAEVYSKLTAISPSGKVLWTYRFADYFSNPPEIDNHNVVYAGSLSGKLYAISTRNAVAVQVPGTYTIKISLANPVLEWKATIGKPTDTIYPAVQSITNELFVSSTSSGVFALNANGSVKWHYSLLNDEVSAAPQIWNGTVYFGTSIAGKLYALSTDGTLKWKYSQQGAFTQSAVIGTPRLIYTGVIFFATSNHYVYAVRPDGTGLWKFHAKGPIATAPFSDYSNGRAYVVTSNGMIYCIG
ncbi:PQQ-binding-like beta-propeller repeat protein [Paenibacillus sp. CF384]|uniref:outer membrane protein assembly factor BamB family protein n=1 Tax=Paenibacillus sp. CF384 TaxID=1884382 RepID=UPI000899E6B6|nr:PQQ-binding-like beta-propeller repeat protein [Paenibacillus sp. CF384]SDW21266.1 Outer membrane protein assembly factor BamB, contains PQQ-like beta-propeller repeat [Paenibacillus sp. CF384]